MRIRLTKLSDRRHRLDILRRDNTSERAELVTRECLLHDFIHFAVEAAMPTQAGFWGSLARGMTLHELNDREAERTRPAAAELLAVEATVGMMTGALKTSDSADGTFANLRRMFACQGQATPPWCNPAFVDSVVGRLRTLQGHWRATPFGSTMEIDWPEPAQPPAD